MNNRIFVIQNCYTFYHGLESENELAYVQDNIGLQLNVVFVNINRVELAFTTLP